MRNTLCSALFVALCCALFASCSADDDVAAGRCSSSGTCPVGNLCVDGRCVARTDAGRVDGGLNDSGAGRDLSVGDIGPMCMSTETPERTCNRLDDDCNGVVDDIDVGGDGLCDCLRIGVLGMPGTLASSSFQGWLEARGTTVTRIGLDDTPLTAAQLAAFDVVVLDRLVREYTTDEAALLLAFVSGGGGLMSMTGYSGGGEDRLRPNGLLAGLGVEYIAELRSGPVTMFEPHPLTAMLTSVTFAGGYRVADLPGATSTRTVVARLTDGAAGVAIEQGEGRAFVWGDEWIQFDSEWSTMPEITRLWVNALSWLGPRDRCVVLF